MENQKSTVLNIMNSLAKCRMAMSNKNFAETADIITALIASDESHGVNIKTVAQTMDLMEESYAHSIKNILTDEFNNFTTSLSSSVFNLN